MAEGIITLVILGIVASIVIPQLMFSDPAKEGKLTLAKKMAEYLTQASTEILLYDATLDDFTRLKDKDGYFSVTDSDVTERMAKLYQKYMKDVDLKINREKEYFSKELVDYNGAPTGLKLNDLYSNFFYVNDGMVMGFRFYGTCDATEVNSIPPTFRQRYEIKEICGSVYYDTNAFNKPNKLGSDQFIIPIGVRGIKYE